MLDALLLRPLPYKDANQIVRIAEFPERRPDQWQGVMIRNFLKYKERSKAFEHMAAIAMNNPRNLNADENPEMLAAQLITAGFLEVFGVQPAFGRSFLPEEYDKSRRDWPVIISDAFWARRFNHDPAAIGNTLLLDGVQHLVIGVMPQDFQPVGEPSVDLWRPRIFSRANLEATYRWQPVFAKLKPGVTIEQAQVRAGSLRDSALGSEGITSWRRVQITTDRRHLRNASQAVY